MSQVFTPVRTAATLPLARSSRCLSAPPPTPTPNQVFMPVGTGAVIEAFQPRMLYGTGFQLASTCDFHHQVLT